MTRDTDKSRASLVKNFVRSKFCFGSFASNLNCIRISSDMLEGILAFTNGCPFIQWFHGCQLATC